MGRFRRSCTSDLDASPRAASPATAFHRTGPGTAVKYSSRGRQADLDEVPTTPVTCAGSLTNPPCREFASRRSGVRFPSAPPSALLDPDRKGGHNSLLRRPDACRARQEESDWYLCADNVLHGAASQEERVWRHSTADARHHGVGPVCPGLRNHFIVPKDPAGNLLGSAGRGLRHQRQHGPEDPVGEVHLL